MSLTYGELFAGYDGLGLGVRSVLGGESLWFAEFDKAPSAILAHHYPDVPNLGDVTKVDWASVPKVDVITGGSPCQDLSHAGKRKGMTDGTRSNLWVEMREAIAVIRPRLVVWENVRGALLTLLPTPRTSYTNGAGAHGTGGIDLRTAAALLPTPRATDGTKGGPNQRGSSGDLMLPSAVGRLLPTPTTTQRSPDANLDSREGAQANLHNEVIAHEQDWREYEAAIRRHEAALGRPAPTPTEPGAKGQPRLSPRFVEWLMMLPVGWVTDVPGISRNDQLKALGNGVVPAQAAAATRAFVHDTALEAVA